MNQTLNITPTSNISYQSSSGNAYLIGSDTNTGGTISNINSHYCDSNCHHWPQIIHEFYPMYWTTWNNKSNIEQAFKVVAKLIEKKLVDIKKVNDFVELVNEIAKIV